MIRLGILALVFLMVFPVFLIENVFGASPVQNPEPTEPTIEQQLELLDEIAPDEGGLIQSIVSHFFEFTVLDATHDKLFLNSFLDSERLGIKWSSGQDIIITSAFPAQSPFLITFEQFPVVKQGSGAVVSTNFLVYNLQVPKTECETGESLDCVQKVRYEIPVTINAILNGTSVSDVGTITISLVDEALDPVLLFFLALIGIPLVGIFIQKARGRSGSIPLRQAIHGS